MTYAPKHLKRWTMPDSYFGETWPDCYSAGVGRSRDSDALERSNFVCMLGALGGESETVVVVRESHWAVGWVEWIAVHESDDKALQAADAAQDALANYPVLDDEHFSELEMEEANEVWQNCYDWQERVKYVRSNRNRFEFRDLPDMLDCIRGKYFAGYASELIR